MSCCALVGAGPFNAECFRARHEADAFACVVAVDGGYASLGELGCTPDVVMGDFDSLGYVPQGLPDAVELHQYPTHKDESDMELALCLAQERGFEEVEVYGAIGGRLDHTLANLQLLASFSEQGLRVTAIDLVEADQSAASSRVEDDPTVKNGSAGMSDGEAVIGTALAFLTGPAELTLEPHPGETVSVFSLSDESHDVTETGLAYPLDHVTLTNRTSWGLSNEFTSVSATISVMSGTLVVFHPLF